MSEWTKKKKAPRSSSSSVQLPAPPHGPTVTRKRRGSGRCRAQVERRGGRVNGYARGVSMLTCPSSGLPRRRTQAVRPSRGESRLCERFLSPFEVIHNISTRCERACVCTYTQSGRRRGGDGGTWHSRGPLTKRAPLPSAPPSTCVGRQPSVPDSDTRQATGESRRRHNGEQR